MGKSARHVAYKTSSCSDLRVFKGVCVWGGGGGEGKDTLGKNSSGQIAYNGKA